jgi:hypothetical protein
VFLGAVCEDRFELLLPTKQTKRVGKPSKRPLNNVGINFDQRKKFPFRNRLWLVTDPLEDNLMTGSAVAQESW